MLLANDEIIIRRVLYNLNNVSRVDDITRSEGVNPALSAFVESEHNNKTPLSPSSAKAPKSVTRPSIGVLSSLKSPV